MHFTCFILRILNSILYHNRARDERVEWLYSGPSGGVNREEYLLGRKIDRLVDPVLAEEEREKEVELFVMWSAL